MDTSKNILDKNTDNFGLRLRALIEKKGKTIDAFADENDIARSTAHNWLNMARPPLEKYWARLSDYFGVSKEYIAHGRPSASPVERSLEPRPDEISKFLLQDDAAAHRASHRTGQNNPVQFSEGFQPVAPTPTRHDCLKHLDEYLRRAEREPGGIGYAYRILLKEFPLDEFDGPQKK